MDAPKKIGSFWGVIWFIFKSLTCWGDFRFEILNSQAPVRNHRKTMHAVFFVGVSWIFCSLILLAQSQLKNPKKIRSESTEEFFLLVLFVSKSPGKQNHPKQNFGQCFKRMPGGENSAISFEKNTTQMCFEKKHQWFL